MFTEYVWVCAYQFEMRNAGYDPYNTLDKMLDLWFDRTLP